MKIGELINSMDFTFSAKYRIIHVESIYDENDQIKGVKLTETANQDSDIPFWLSERDIIAINEGDDGVLEIEYTDMIGDYMPEEEE